MFTEQRIRGVLFYSSVIIFLAGLPFIISFALGYKFDRKAMKFTRTGIIYLKTQPSGSSIYLNEKLIDEKTPATLRELLPGSYHIKLELEKHYPWSGDAKVEASKASVLDKIILFPLRPNIKQLNKERFNYFWADEDKAQVYYVNYADNSVYVSDSDGTKFEKAAGFINIIPQPLKWRASLDREKLLYFNRHQIGITYIALDNAKTFYKLPFLIDYQGYAILDAFWHSDNYHLIIITDKNIEVREARPDSTAVELVKLNKKNAEASYNVRDDTLYFMDSQTGYDGNVYNNLYRLELNARTFSFQQLIKLNANE